MRDTNDEQRPINVVRLRYAESPVFIDLPNITGQFKVAGQANYAGGIGYQFPSLTDLGIGGVNARDTPTLSYHPREGREIAEALLAPISADLFNVLGTGAHTEQLFVMTVNDLNDVPNAPGATTPTPRFPTTTRSSSKASGRAGDRNERGDSSRLGSDPDGIAPGARPPERRQRWLSLPRPK
jgi:hypothetical protein